MSMSLIKVRENLAETVNRVRFGGGRESFPSGTARKSPRGFPSKIFAGSKRSTTRWTRSSPSTDSWRIREGDGRIAY